MYIKSNTIIKRENKELIIVNIFITTNVLSTIMSISLSTLESTLTFALKFYNESYKLYYDKEYLTVLIDMITKVLPVNIEREFRISNLTLKEPIILREPIIIISEQMIADLINSEIMTNKYFTYFEETEDIYSFVKDYAKKPKIEEKYKKLSADKKYIIVVLFRLALVVRHCFYHTVDKTEEKMTHDTFPHFEFADEFMQSERGLVQKD